MSVLQVTAGADGGQQKDDKQNEPEGTVVDQGIQHVLATGIYQVIFNTLIHS